MNEWKTFIATVVALLAGATVLVTLIVSLLQYSVARNQRDYELRKACVDQKGLLIGNEYNFSCVTAKALQ